MARSFLSALGIFCITGCSEPETPITGDPIAPERIAAGSQLIPTKCNTCHGVYEREMNEMLAPPLWAVRAHYLSQFEEPESFAAAIADFLAEPKVDRSLMPIELARYGLKAPVSLTESEAESIALAIYAGQVERPPWARTYQKLHADCDASW